MDMIINLWITAPSALNTRSAATGYISNNLMRKAGDSSRHHLPSPVIYQDNSPLRCSDPTRRPVTTKTWGDKAILAFSPWDAPSEASPRTAKASISSILIMRVQPSQTIFVHTFAHAATWKCIYETLLLTPHHPWLFKSHRRMCPFVTRIFRCDGRRKERVLSRETEVAIYQHGSNERETAY